MNTSLNIGNFLSSTPKYILRFESLFLGTSNLVFSKITQIFTNRLFAADETVTNLVGLRFEQKISQQNQQSIKSLRANITLAAHNLLKQTQTLALSKQIFASESR